MPTIGFGTAGLSIGTADAVLTALDAGYRFDLLPAAGDVATVFMLFHCSSSFVVKCIHSAGRSPSRLQARREIEVTVQAH